MPDLPTTEEETRIRLGMTRLSFRFEMREMRSAALPPYSWRRIEALYDSYKEADQAARDWLIHLAPPGKVIETRVKEVWTRHDRD